MTTNTVQNVELSLILDGSEYQCQVIDTELNLPGTAPGESVEVACPGGIVSEPGSTTDGSLTGNVFADPADGGITWALIQAYTTGAEMAYEYVLWKDRLAAAGYSPGDVRPGTDEPESGILTAIFDIRHRDC